MELVTPTKKDLEAAHKFFIEYVKFDGDNYTEIFPDQAFVRGFVQGIQYARQGGGEVERTRLENGQTKSLAGSNPALASFVPLNFANVPKIKPIIKKMVDDWLLDKGIDAYSRVELVWMGNVRKGLYWYDLSGKISIHNGKGSIDGKHKWLNKITISFGPGGTLKLVKAATDVKFLEPTGEQFMNFIIKEFEVFKDGLPTTNS